MSAQRLCALDDLTDLEPHRFVVGGRAIAVIRLGDEVYAIGDVCSHQDVSLSDGEVDPDTCALECPKHGSGFDIRTGAALSLPALKPVPTYDVRVVDGDVVLDSDATGTSEAV